MKLSQVVAYLNLLDSLNVAAECNNATEKLANITYTVNEHSEIYTSLADNIAKSFNELQHNIGKFSASVEQLREELRQEIQNKDAEYIELSNKIWQGGMRYDSIELILNRRMRIDAEDDDMLRSHLRNLTDWRFPGMIVRPGLETFIEDMVPLDPLYVVDHNLDLIEPSVSKFTPEYQRRLRKYVIDDQQDGEILGNLPNNQFGVIFAYHFFNHKPLELINRYLTEFYNKLRPGGHAIVTYNNCDLAHGVIRTENAWMLYAPKRLVLDHACSLGFELARAHDGAGDVSWLELRKPGDLNSLRGGQTLAKIVAKTN
jgi:SAM-dependent methyltransferase